MKKKALVIGLLGQDGSYLAELLHKKGYEVFGIVRENQQTGKGSRIEWMLNLISGIRIFPVDILDKAQLRRIIETICPHEIYNFAGDSNVFNAWSNLDLTLDLNARVPQHILEIILGNIKFSGTKFFQASSCLTFGRDTSGAQNERTPANPIHPYGITKNYSTNMVKEFRHSLGVFAVSGIFFNHESERRGNDFFSKKITSAVAKIKDGSDEKIDVGNLSAQRDFGYAPDFMEAVWLMMQNEKPTDYVIGTGKLISMEEFVKKSFEYVGLDYKKFIRYDETLHRKNDTAVLRADITKIQTELGWTPTHTVDEMIAKMIDYELERTLA